MALIPGNGSLDDVLQHRPPLAGRYLGLVAEAEAALDPSLAALLRARFATLHGLPAAPATPDGEAQECAVEFAELFVIDPHAISDELAADIVRLLGESGLVAVASACAMFDSEMKLRKVLEVSS
jgi:hypothetical protein